MRSSPWVRQRSGRSGRWYGAVALVAAVGMALAPSALAHAGHYAQRNLVSDQPGKAELLDTEPGQRVGAGLRADHPGVGGRQRHRRFDPVLRCA